MNYLLDGLTPSSVEKPTNLEELSTSLSKVHDSNLSAVPWGGGTRIGVGNIPSSYDTAIDLSGFEGEIEHVPGDMTVVANAGVTIGTLNHLLANEGQRLAFEVRNPEMATVGGSVASNAPGRRQSSTGGIRDWVIGMQVVLADGTVTKSGGRVVKNVQGYEMHRLNTGAYGTLGVVSQAAFKLLPVPPEQQTVVVWFDDLDSSREVGLRIVNGQFMPESISLVSGSLANDVVETANESRPTSEIWALIVRLGGGVRSIERQVNEVVGAAGSSSAAGYAVVNDSTAKNVWSKLDTAETSSDLSVRMTSLPVSTIDAAQAVQSEVASSHQSGVSSICDLGFGASTLLVDDVDEQVAPVITETIVGGLKNYNGSFVIEKCPLNVKESRDVFSDVGSSIELMRRIKHQYDPSNTLNPGRFAGKI